MCVLCLFYVHRFCCLVNWLVEVVVAFVDAVVDAIVAVVDAVVAVVDAVVAVVFCLLNWLID